MTFDHLRLCSQFFRCLCIFVLFSLTVTLSALAQSEVNHGKINPEVLKALGVKRLPKGMSVKLASQKIAQNLISGNPGAQILSGLPPGTGIAGASPINPLGGAKPGSSRSPLVGQPLSLNEMSALSAALITTIGGRDNQFSEVALLADWDGREDCTADRGAKIDDFSGVESDIDFSLTRAAISEHTFANGHNFNSYYYGDTIGNLWFGFDLVGSAMVDTVIQVNIPDLVSNPTGSNGFILLNPTAGDCMDDQATITGIAVNPVADLGDFDPALCGVTGEIIYVSVWDTEGCAANAAGNPIRTRIFAFAIFEVGGTEFLVPGVQQVLRSKFSNIAGLAVDDDGNLYYQLLDLLNVTNGGALFKATEIPRVVANCGAQPRINRAIPSIPDPPTLNSWIGTTANPVLVASGVRNTNYGGGAAGLFGNIVTLATGANNVLFAGVARSAVGAGDTTEGLFVNPSALGVTPSMVVSFADCSGGASACTAPAAGISGVIPVGDGFADPAQAGVSRVAGVNNFRLFVLGNGPDLRPGAGGSSVVPQTPSSLLKVDMQIDYTLHSGIAVGEDGTVFIISGGTPAGIGKNPSPMFSEILCFEDACPMDRRADFVDLRGSGVPNPPASGGNVGNGVSDRFDHIWYQAPFDQVTVTPAGLSGLARGFLRYTNRLAPNPLSPGVGLGTSKATQNDDDTDGPIIFENLDPGHQVAGGDDQTPPNRGDDNDGLGGAPTANNPGNLIGAGGVGPLVGPLSGGFEFVFGATGVPNSASIPCVNKVWNDLFLNSNGNLTFGGGDTDNTPTVPELRTGLPRIAPAWADLNPAARALNPINFPVQALGFANVNAFRIRWINVPEFGSEGCATGGFGIGGNTFGITLFDDGTGLDENHNQALQTTDLIGQNDVDGGDAILGFDRQEGPVDLRYVREPNTGVLIGCPPRRESSGHFVFDYGLTELLGTTTSAVITGYSVGGLSPLNPPGLCATNLSEVARASDANPFGVINGQSASIQACLIGEGTEPTIYELFNSSTGGGIGSGGEVTFATPDFDLRFEGNDPAMCTPARQRDLNRGKVGFFGVSCPVNPLCLAVTPVGTVTVAPGQPAVGSAAAGSQLDANGNRIATPTSGIINAVCNVQLNFLGCFFIPNEVTVICQGFGFETGVPLQRPGKTVTNTLALVCDTNGDGLPDTTAPLTNVSPVNINLVRGTLPAPGQSIFTSGSFPLSCCGGLANLTLTTTFTSGDNNIFGAFALTSTCVIDLGVRAPVIISVTPSGGDCTVAQDLLISGVCFVLPSFGPNGVGSTNVTSVFAVESGNPSHVIPATRFVALNANLVDAYFEFGTANRGKTFLIFVSGPNGTLSASSLTCPTAGGSQPDNQVTFKCDNPPPPNPGGDPPPPDNAVLSTCLIERTDAGAFVLTLTGRNIFGDSEIKVGGTVINKKKYKSPDLKAGYFTKVILKGQVLCTVLPGAVTIKNNSPSGGLSSPFQCDRSCPAQN